MPIRTLAELSEVVRVRAVLPWCNAHPGVHVESSQASARRASFTLAGPGRKLVVGVEPAGLGPAAVVGRSLAVLALSPPSDKVLFDELARAIAGLELELDAALREAPAPGPRHDAVERGGRLYNAARSERAFHVVNLGLPKTGTTSVAVMFSDFRAAHEFWSEPVAEMLLARRSGRASNAELIALLVERERAGRLELDSASFLHCAVEEVVRLYPEARYAFGWRPFGAWLDSLLGMLLDRGGGSGVAPEGERWSRWERAILTLILGDFRAQWFAVPGAIDAELPRLAHAALEHWLGAMERCLTLLPEGSLIFPTAELDHLAPAFAELAGVPAANVHPARDNVSPRRVTLWARLPRALRDEASERSAPLLELARRRGPASVTSA